jgi:protein-tyrosine phosphatase
MKYGILFATVGIAFLLQALMHGGPWWALVWPGVSFGIAASAYIGIGPRVFGKNADGTMAWYTVVTLLPYLLLTWLLWHLVRATTSEDCYNEVAPGLLVGRRPLGGEVPKQVKTIVDLTAEFIECRAVRHGREYISFPMLDTGTSGNDVFNDIVNRVAESSETVYIHCALGHGRTGTLAAAVLVVRGKAATTDEAISQLREVRPRLELSRKQVKFVRRFIENRMV